MNIGDNIKKYRKIKGYRIIDLADKVNVSKQAISLYERGEREPKLSMLSSIAKALDIEVVDLLGVTDISIRNSKVELSKKEVEYIKESLRYNMKRYEEVLFIMHKNDIVEGRETIIHKIEELDELYHKICMG